MQSLTRQTAFHLMETDWRLVEKLTLDSKMWALIGVLLGPHKRVKVADIPEETQPVITPNSKRHLELDLDYLERRQHQQPNATTGDVRQEACSPVETSPEYMDLIKIILLGAPSVGKTSIIQQFVLNQFQEDYMATDRKYTYYPTVITNERWYKVKISDLPVIPYFPVNSFYEWANYRYYGLRSATAYILVFDLSNIDTFQYIKTLREQICESRNMQNVPVLVVGNKEDLIVSEDVPSNSKPAISSSSDEKRRDIVNLVKKHWKCGYMECSAKYNWRVMHVFKELMNMIETVSNRDQSPMLDNIQEALDRNKCVVI
ncbi:ras-like protein family member 10B [Dendroctonus ponderosae]|nr:ras-like protein family member 10B [Dendroctonus ponderosae]